MTLVSPFLLHVRLPSNSSAETRLFAVEQCAWQAAEGRAFVLEAPVGDSSWGSPEVLSFMRQKKPEASLVRLQDEAGTEQLLRRLQNSKGVFDHTMMMDWDHWEDPPDESTVMLAAIEGVLDDMLPKALPEEIFEVYAAGVPLVGDSDATDAQLEATILKLHRNLGHPSKEDLTRVLGAAKALPRAIEIAKNMKCSVCMENKQPKPARPASIIPNWAPFESISLDVKWLPGRTRTAPRRRFLNIVDDASSLQRMIPLSGDTADDIWAAYDAGWRAPYGRPKRLRVDPAKNMLFGRMQRGMEEDGVSVERTAGEASWQLGKAERHGGWFSSIFSRVLRDLKPQSEEEYLTAVRATEVARNSLLRRFGFSPFQIALGRDPEQAGDLLQDVPSVTANSLAVSDLPFQRLLQIRTICRRACLEASDSKAFRLALNARPRTVQELEAESCVFIWRKGKGHGLKKGTQARWTGPGVLVGKEKGNWWVATPGQMLKATPEHLRMASPEELVTNEHLVEAILRNLKEENMAEQGFVDLTHQECPPEGIPQDWHPTAEEDPLFETDKANLPADPLATPDNLAETVRQQQEAEQQTGLPAGRVPANESSSSSSSPPAPAASLHTNLENLLVTVNKNRWCAEEELRPFLSFFPNVKITGARLNYRPQRMATPRPQLDSGAKFRWAFWLDSRGELQVSAPEEWARDETQWYRKLPGTGVQSVITFFSDPNPQESQASSAPSGPSTPEEFPETPNPPKLVKDGSSVGSPMTQSPATPRRPSMPGSRLPSKEAATAAPEGTSSSSSATPRGLVRTASEAFGPESDTGPRAKAGGEAASFFLSLSEDEPGGELEVCFAKDAFLTMGKRGKKEISDKEVKEFLPERFEECKVKEWQKLMAHGALTLLSPSESTRIRQVLPHRIIGSRYVNTVEDDADEADGVKCKSRFCLLGHQDPDVFDLAREHLTASPTVSTAGRTTCLQLLASFRWRAQLGDVESAFLTTKKLAERAPRRERAGGLFCELPRSGVPGIEKGLLCRVDKLVYGLGDAPLGFQTGSAECMEECGFVAAALDPCLFFLFENQRLIGIACWHVDDLLIEGDEGNRTFNRALAQIRARWTFRKWKIGSGKFCGTEIEQDPRTFEIRQTQQEFIAGMKQPLCAKVQEQTLLAPGEIAELRSSNGSGNWLASQTRPDLSCQTSLAQQGLPAPVGRHARLASQVVRRAKQFPEIGLVFRSIRPDKLRVCGHSDAAFDRDSTGRSQSGFVLGFCEDHLVDGKQR